MLLRRAGACGSHARGFTPPRHAGGLRWGIQRGQAGFTLPFNRGGQGQGPGSIQVSSEGTDTLNLGERGVAKRTGDGVGMKGKIWLGKQWVGINQVRGWSEDAFHFRNQKTSAVQCRSLKKCSRVHWRGDHLIRTRGAGGDMKSVALVRLPMRWQQLDKNRV